jgi:adenylate cyclase
MASMVLDRFNGWIVVILGLNVGGSLAAALLVRPGTYRKWMPWALATLDGVMLVVILSGGALDILGGAYAPAVTYSWALFLLMALTAIRYDTRLVIYLSVLFAAILAGVMLAGTGIAVAPNDPFGETMVALHGPGPNTARLALLLITGLILAAMVARGRRSIVEAVEAARRTANLSRHFAPPVAALLANTDSSALRHSRRQNTAILVADVRGFTALAERLDPARVAEFVNEFRRRTTWAIESHGGIIDKFVGDNVMGVFGAIEPGPEDAVRALAAAQTLAEAIDRWNIERQDHGYPSVVVGIGLHHGPVFTGVLGTEERQEFTVIGDVVNTAHRIEELTKELGTSLLVSAQVLEAAGVSPEDANWMPLPPQSLRGRSEPVQLFELSSQREA